VLGRKAEESFHVEREKRWKKKPNLHCLRAWGEGPHEKKACSGERGMGMKKQEKLKRYHWDGPGEF